MAKELKELTSREENYSQRIFYFSQHDEGGKSVAIYGGKR
ncbi:hypothetical protein Barb6XT_02767 [Bacteroidales bacterium Barb6XT]|nr:hypothetical protein Barb6XT_02767 [Bacteroidales bacterium Barb6XT]